MRRRLARLRLLESRHEFVERQVQLLNFRLVFVDVVFDFGSARFRLLEIQLLSLAKLFSVLDRLLEASDFRADLVKLSLYGIEFVVALAQAIARFLDIGFELALLSDGRLEARLAL